MCSIWFGLWFELPFHVLPLQAPRNARGDNGRLEGKLPVCVCIHVRVCVFVGVLRACMQAWLAAWLHGCRLVVARLCAYAHLPVTLLVLASASARARAHGRAHERACVLTGVCA